VSAERRRFIGDVVGAAREAVDGADRLAQRCRSRSDATGKFS